MKDKSVAEQLRAIEVREKIEIRLTIPSKLRRWAAENAYMLIMLAVLFGITWAYLIIDGVRHAT